MTIEEALAIGHWVQSDTRMGPGYHDRLARGIAIELFKAQAQALDEAYHGTDCGRMYGYDCTCETGMTRDDLLAQVEELKKGE